MNQDTSFKKSISSLVTRFTYVIIVIIISFVSLLIWQFHSFTEADELVRHTHVVIHTIEEARSLLVDMETGMRGFALTGTSDFLWPYQRSEKKLDKAIDTLKNQVNDNKSQVLRAEDLDKKVDSWKNYAEKRIAEKKRKNSTEENKNLLRNQTHGKALMDSLREELNNLQNEEINLLQIRRNKLKHNYKIFISLILISGAILITAVVLLFKRHLNLISIVHQKLLDSASESESNLRAILDNSPAYIYYKDLNGKYIIANKKMCKALGKNIEEVLGKTDNELFTKTFADNSEKIEKQILESGKAQTSDDIVFIKNEKRIFLSTKFPVTLNNHNLAIAGITMDITESRRSEDQFRAITELAPQFVWISDSNGEIIYSNSSLKDFMGVDQETLLGEKWINQLHPDDRESTIEAWQKSIESGKNYEIEFRVKNKNNEYAYFLNRAAPIRDTDTGKINRWLGVSIDITNRKAIEDELKRTSNILKLIMSSTDDVIYVKDRESRMIYCNPIALRLLNTTEKELYGKHDVEFLGPGHGGEEILINDDKIMKTAKAESIEEHVTWNNGLKRIYLSQKNPWFDRFGNVVGLVGLSRDITDLKNIQTQLEEAIKTRDDFLSVASHELKTPLSSLKLQAQQIQKLYAKEKYDELTLPRLKKFVDLTDKQVERLDRLVEDMLDISRIRSGKLAMNPIHTSLNEIVLGVVERLKPTMEAAGTTPILNLHDKVVGIWDKMRLEQVVTNLLTNAMRYGDHKPVTVSLTVEDGSALLVVRDEGIGMTPETLGKIFQQFERGVSIDISGLGLGLFITRQIIELHGGKIWAESAGKNLGSTFYVRLPRFSADTFK